jgi:hypothetical protein
VGRAWLRNWDCCELRWRGRRGKKRTERDGEGEAKGGKEVGDELLYILFQSGSCGYNEKF